MDNVKIKKPVRNKMNAIPPSENETTRNLNQLSSEETVCLNFKVPPKFGREFKAYCYENSFTMKYFLQEAFVRLKDEMRR